MKCFLMLAAVISSIFYSFFAGAQEKDLVQVKLYVLDCGRIDVLNLAKFSDTGDYDGKSTQLADPCFLIVHPKGMLLWDTGLSDSFVKNPETVMNNYHLTKSMTLQDSLKKMNIKSSDITYVSVSHSHFDHMGGLDQFPQATWILQKAELNYSKLGPNAGVVDFSQLTSWKKVHKNIIEGDYDVFGDGTVLILSTPGHTAGHQSLEVKLPRSGVIILSGDLFHQRTSVDPLRIPAFNASRADTMASVDRIKSILKNTNGKLVVQHDAGDFEKLPVYPAYLD